MIESGSYFNWDEKGIKEFLDGELLLTPLYEFRDTVYNIIYSAFHTNLGDTTTLSKIDPSDMHQEIRFQHPTGIENQQIKGFIDLVFVYENKFYLLDWKMNLLANYDNENLMEEMRKHHYYTQEKIYRDVIEKHIKTVGHHFSFGNSFYFFLRGKERGVLSIGN